MADEGSMALDGLLRTAQQEPDTDFPREGVRALVAAVQEASVQGVSTRRVDDLVKALGYRRNQQEPSQPAVPGA